MMHDVYYSSTNGKLTGRTSYFWRKKLKVQKIVENQNRRSKGLGKNIRYELVSIPVDQANKDEVR